MEEALSRRRRRKVRINWGRLLLILAACLLALGLIIGTAGFVFLNAFNHHGVDFGFLQHKDASAKDDRVNFLILGTDVGTLGADPAHNRTRSDTIMVASVNIKNGSVNIINIPRDTLVDIPGRSNPDKITHAHAFGGPELSVATVENFLGIQIDHYIEINYDGFAKLIDAIGGVPVNVPKRLYYVDPVQNLVINLHKGEQVLDGKDALGFVRFRHDALGDIGRVQRQQEFIKALAKKMLSPGSITKLPEIIKVLPDCIFTDMSPTDITYFASKVPSFKEGKVTTKMIPGTDATINGISYWQPDMEATRQLVEEMTTDQGVQNESEQGVQNKSDLRIQVLNGSGVSGAAKDVASEIETGGYKVEKTGNADNFNYDNTQVISYGADKDAELIAKKILHGAEVIHGQNGENGLDITVIVGKNYQ